MLRLSSLGLSMLKAEDAVEGTEKTGEQWQKETRKGRIRADLALLVERAVSSCIEHDVAR